MKPRDIATSHQSLKEKDTLSLQKGKMALLQRMSTNDSTIGSHPGLAKSTLVSSVLEYSRGVCLAAHQLFALEGWRGSRVGRGWSQQVLCYLPFSHAITLNLIRVARVSVQKPGITELYTTVCHLNDFCLPLSR